MDEIESKCKEPIIALHGLPRAGKDTLAELLIRHGVRWHHGLDIPKRFAFADALYEELAEMFTVPVALLRSAEWKTQPQEDLALWHCAHPQYRQWLHSRDIPVFDAQTSRFHLRMYGTDFTVAFRPQDHWACTLVEALDAYEAQHDGVIVISDLRRIGASMHELETLRRWGHHHERAVVVVAIERPGYAHPPAHASDSPFPPGTSDVTLQNIEGAAPEAMLEQLLTFLHNHPSLTKVRP